MDKIGDWEFYFLHMVLYIALVEIGIYWMHLTLHIIFIQMDTWSQ
jgi:hypothetical protein